MTSPFTVCPFTYGDSPYGGVVMPMTIANQDPSNTTTVNYPPGYLWLSDLTQGGTGNLFVNEGYVSGLPNWVALSAGAAGALNTLSDGSTTVFPIAGNIAIKSTANQVTATSSGATHSIFLSLPSTLISPGSIQSTTTITAGTGLTVTTGNILVSAGNITLTSGNLTLSSGNILASPVAGCRWVECRPLCPTCSPRPIGRLG